MVAEALAALLRDRGFEIVARAHDCAAAEAALSAGGIDVAIVDIDLAEAAPGEMLGRLRDCAGHVPIVITAPRREHHGVAGVIDKSADGLVLKSESAETLAECLAVVTAGGRWLERSATERQAGPNDADALTRRERDVAKLVATGRRNREIACALGISEGTVKMHLHNVYTKYGVESRTQLAMDDRLRMLG